MFDRVYNLAQLFSKEDDLIRVPAGRILYRQGMPGKYLYVVKYGDVEISVDDRLTESGSAGCLLGEECLLDNSPRRATVITVSDCGLVPIDQHRLDHLIAKTPGLWTYLKNIQSMRYALKNGIHY